MNAILPRLSDQTCAELAMRKSTPEGQRDLMKAVRALEENSYASWLALSRKAAVAEAEGVGGREQSQEEIGASLQQLKERLTAAEGQRLLSGLSGSARVEEAAWALRNVYAQAVDLPEPHRSILLRALVSP